MHTVALYGTSLLLSGIGASLERRAGVHVLPAEAALPGAVERLTALQPDVVVFDLAAACLDSVISLWRALPHLTLIGVDLSADRALVLSGQPALVLTAQDLADVIESQVSAHKRKS